MAIAPWGSRRAIFERFFEEWKVVAGGLVGVVGAILCSGILVEFLVEVVEGRFEEVVGASAVESCSLVRLVRSRRYFIIFCFLNVRGSEN